MKKLLISVAFAALFAGSAMAADLPAKAVHYAAPTPINWTGWYLGLHVGAGQQTSDSSTVIPGIGSFSIGNSTASGMIGGVQAGYNYQAGWAVYGIEGAFSGSGISGGGACVVLGATCSVNSKWFASISGRVGGLVTDRFLAYVKAGAVWENWDYKIDALGLGQASASTTGLGYLFGLGGEYKFSDKWSGFTEYNYMDFGSKDMSFAALGGGVISVKNSAHIIKAGVNYKF